MPFNGTGAFSRIYSWVTDAANGVLVDATRTDTDSDDIADGLSNCITKDGQQVIIADIPFGGNKITELGNGASPQDATTVAQVFTSPTISDPTFTGTVTVPTATAGDNSTKAASTAFATALAFAAALPAQAGNSGKFIATNGLTASWSNLTLQISARTSNTILGVADQAYFVDVTSGTFSQTFTAAATLGNGWYCIYRNSGTGDITLDPNGSETIDGLTSFIMYPGEARIIQCNGTAFTSIVAHPFSKTFTATGTFTKPPGYNYFGGIAWSGGSSGERTNNIATLSRGGGGGGCFPFNLKASVVGATESVTIGAGGSAVTTVTTGTLGGNTSFGSLITVYGATSFTRGGAVGFNSPFVDTSSATPQGFAAIVSVNTGINQLYGGGNVSNDATTESGSSVYGSGGGGSVTAAGVLKSAGSSINGGAGGAASIAGNGADGTAPGGGGGATQTGTQSGAGARGELRIWGIA